MRRVTALGAALVAIAGALALVFWTSTAPHPNPDQLRAAITGVAFGEKAVFLSERDASGQGLAKLALPSGDRVAESRFRDPVRVVGVHPKALWVLSGGVWAVSPADLSVLASPTDLAELLPDHAQRLLTPRRVEVAADGTLLLPGPPALGLSPDPWRLEPAEGAMPRTFFAREVPLGPGRATFEPSADAPVLYDANDVPSPMNRELHFEGGTFMLDGRSGAPMVVAQPTSLIVVDQNESRVSRLALHGAVLWQASSDVWGGGSVHAGTLDGAGLVLWAGGRVLALELDSGRVHWEYSPVDPGK